MCNLSNGPDQFHAFQALLDRDDIIDHLRMGLIGEDVLVPGPNGATPMIYADYVASGRALRQIEDFVSEQILPFYANSHTEASYCGQMMTRLRRQARNVILKSCGGTGDYSVIFTGSGATAGINRLVNLFGLNAKTAKNAATRPVVLIGPYEHHSNILPWRESGADVIEITEAETGGPDLKVLEQVLQDVAHRPVIGAFSAMSNVTGIITDVKAVTRLLKSFGAKTVWDYAGGGPYLPIDMAAGTDAEIDAVVVSPHKFIGGPGASGVLILRRDAVISQTPTFSGGGTVSFVSPWGHDYSDDVVAREEAGTPNVIGDLRAALCFMVKDAIGQDFITARLDVLRQRAMTHWADTPGLTLLGNLDAPRIPVFSFTVTAADGQPVHQQLVTRILSDFYGVQARGGCACAGPYGHRLLGIDHAKSDAFRTAIQNGDELEKPGWTRLGFSPLMSDEKADKIIAAVAAMPQVTAKDLARYRVDPRTARFAARAA